MFASLVYFLCGVTSLGCAGLLFRSYRRTRGRFAFWASLAFGFFTVNNFFVMSDFIWFPNEDLSFYRLMALLLGAGVMILGLIWESV